MIASCDLMHMEEDKYKIIIINVVRINTYQKMESMIQEIARDDSPSLVILLDVKLIDDAIFDIIGELPYEPVHKYDYEHNIYIFFDIYSLYGK